jgi:hypothetical protein
MSKYTPLFDYLRRKSASELELSFTDIERMLGAMLPNSASRPQWWANEKNADTRHVQTSAWLDAGYEAFLIARQDKVRFRRRNS